MLSDTLSSATHLLGGWNAGYSFAICKEKEDEIKQGSNYIIASLMQAGQMGVLGSVISQVAEHSITNSTARIGIQILCNVLPIALLPLTLFNGVVKQGNYPSVAETLNKRINIFPTTINTTLAKFSGFFAEHGGKILQVAMLVSSIALIALGNYAFAAATLTALAYNIVDHAGYVPRKISLFMEKYMPTVALIGGVVGGTVVLQVISAVMLISHSDTVRLFLYDKVDWVGRKLLGRFKDAKELNEIIGPGMSEFNTSIHEKRNLSCEEIYGILNESRFSFEIDPAHCSKEVAGNGSLPEDRNFGDFLSLFNEIDWSKKYAIVKGKLIDDDNFHTYILSIKPEMTNEKLRSNFDSLMTEIAATEMPGEENQTKEKFAAKWLTDQMEVLHGVVTSQNRVKGSQFDLEEALNDLAKILSHIKELKQKNAMVDFEDNLLKLAVEGGNYCARGIKRAAGEMVSAIALSGSGESSNDTYETKLKQALLDERSRLVQSTYQLITDSINLPDALKNDVHFYDMYRRALSFGLLPMSDADKSRFGLQDFQIWEQMSLARANILSNYQDSINDVFVEVGAVNFAYHMMTMINANSSLTKDQKDNLEDRLIDPGVQIDRFQRLMLVMLGILRVKD